jgi:hypothetical protein
MLSKLFEWLNANLPLDPRKPLTPQDVAHISVSAGEFAQLPGNAQTCAYRRVSFKHAHGMEFWLTPYPLPSLRGVSDLRGRIAWKPTGNTAALFRLKQR